MYARFAVVFGLLMLPPAAVSAGFELTVTSGIRRGQSSFPIEARTSAEIVCITTPCVLAQARMEDDRRSYSLILDAPISKLWMIEALVSRENGDLDLSSEFPVRTLGRESFRSTSVQLGLLRQWGEGRLRPFVSASVGGTRFESTALAYEGPPRPGAVAAGVDEEVPSASLAGGVKIGIGRHLAARAEGRAYWHDLPSRLDGSLRQAEASVGLTYRW